MISISGRQWRTFVLCQRRSASHHWRAIWLFQYVIHTSSRHGGRKGIYLFTCLIYFWNSDPLFRPSQKSFHTLTGFWVLWRNEKIWIFPQMDRLLRLMQRLILLHFFSFNSSWSYFTFQFYVTISWVKSLRTLSLASRR